MGHTSDLDSFLTLHKDQLLSSGVPECFWKTLYTKLLNQTFDVGSVVQLIRFSYEQEERQPYEPVWGLQALVDIQENSSENIFLIDHAWTYRLENTKQQLLQHESLRQRLSSILDINPDQERDKVIEEIIKELPRVTNTYSILNAEEIENRLPIWYVMDEIGCAVNHSGAPNCKIVPFVFVSEQMTYSILFPLDFIEKDDLLTRDFAEGITSERERSTALIPWRKYDIPDNVTTQSSIPDEDYFLGGHIRESLPKLENLKSQERKIPLKVYTEYSMVQQYLTDKNYELVECENEADILWLTSHFKTFAELSETPQKFVNQFPFEYVITIKDLLSITCRRCTDNNTVELPDWLPRTYNLKTEIENFICCFKERESEGKENHWIIKPYNLARGIDTHITDNLNFIIRMANTGPKIVQKYITNPVLFHRPECAGSVKFDIRYVLLLKSVHPLQVYAYRNFFLRFANVPFELRDFDVYEKHFTVMNYTENADLRHMKCVDFKTEWQRQYGNYPWTHVEEQIIQMFRSVFEKATLAQPPCGIAQSPQSRALYAADLMLEWNEGEMQPKLLEVNWTPDCKRACEYYPDFYNDIFNLLFLDKESDAFAKL